MRSNMVQPNLFQGKMDSGGIALSSQNNVFSKKGGSVKVSRKKKKTLVLKKTRYHKDLKEDFCVFSGFLEILTLCVFFLQDFSRS